MTSSVVTVMKEYSAVGAYGLSGGQVAWDMALVALCAGCGARTGGREPNPNGPMNTWTLEAGMALHKHKQGVGCGREWNTWTAAYAKGS